MDRGSKKGERLRDYLMKQTPSVTMKTVDDECVDVGLHKALEHRDRLLEYDKTRCDEILSYLTVVISFLIAFVCC